MKHMATRIDDVRMSHDELMERDKNYFACGIIVGVAGTVAVFLTVVGAIA